MYIFQDVGCSQMSVELRQTVSLVYDMVILGNGNQDWSIKKLFGIGLSGACPLATMSNIYIDTTLNEVCYTYFDITSVAVFVDFLKTTV
jgi:phosphatidylinositol glycan class T